MRAEERRQPNGEEAHDVVVRCRTMRVEELKRRTEEVGFELIVEPRTWKYWVRDPVLQCGPCFKTIHAAAQEVERLRWELHGKSGR
jgi:hypothetical protein